MPAGKKVVKKTGAQKSRANPTQKEFKSLSTYDRTEYINKAIEILTLPVSEGLSKYELRDDLSPLEIGMMKLVTAVMAEDNERPMAFIHRNIIDPLDRITKRKKASLDLEAAMKQIGSRLRDDGYDIVDVLTWYADNVSKFSHDEETMKMFFDVAKYISDVASRSKQIELQREILAYSRINAIPLEKMNGIIHIIQEVMKKYMSTDPERLQMMAQEIFDGFQSLLPAFNGTEHAAIEHKEV